MNANPWLQTHGGGVLDLVTLDGIDIRDIAHALGGICRYNGHTRRHLSVAEHCCRVADWLLDLDADSEIVERATFGRAHFRKFRTVYALSGLLHDAHEAYTADLTHPLLCSMSPAFRAEWRACQQRVDVAIIKALGLTPSVPQMAIDTHSDVVKYADVHILLDERDAVMTAPPRDWDVVGALGVPIEGWDRDRAAHEWLGRLGSLFNAWRLQNDRIQAAIDKFVESMDVREVTP